MRKSWIALGLVLLLSACGTEGKPLIAEDPENGQTEQSSEENETADRVGQSEEQAESALEREIIAKLKQTAEPVARNEAAKAVVESTEFKEGYLGEPTEELAKDMAVQAIEMNAVSNALEEMYGGHEGFRKAGIVFLENRRDGSEKPGVWIGIKNPDERLDELVATLQEQVDAGEILAEPIHIYKSDHTQADLRAVTDKAWTALKKMREAHHRPQSASAGVSTDTITGTLEISHNFLSEEQKKEVEAAFPEREVVFEQSGTMVPGPDEPDVVYPDPATVAEPSIEGVHIVEVSPDEFLTAASIDDKDYLSSSAYYKFTDAADKLEVGQRVKVGSTGSMQASYPGQGTAVRVEVFPAYQPENADLTEAEAVKLALEEARNKQRGLPGVTVEYSAEKDEWLISLVFEDGTEEVAVPDQ